MYRSPTESDPAPLHPGEVLRVDILPCLSMSPSELAAHLDLPRATLDGLLAERTRITPDLAKRLGVALGQGAHYWLALQLQFDLWQAAQTDLTTVRPVTWGRGTRRTRPVTAANAPDDRSLFGS
jgi:addiction module HigA family antidote